MVINSNVSADTAARNLASSSDMLAKSLARLSSGSKIVSPEDDAGGLAVAMKLDSSVTRDAAAQSNLTNAKSFEQTQDGFLQKVSTALSRMSELTTLAQDATKTDSDRSLYNQEFSTLQSYITSASSKDFNGVSLFDGTTLNITTDGDSGTSGSFAMTGVNLAAGASYTTVTATTTNITSTSNAASALTTVKAAISQLSKDRANIGANISRLDLHNDQLGVLKDNLSAATSRIKDVDVAQESTTFARLNILVQAGTAMLAQANQTPQSVLRLIQ